MMVSRDAIFDELLVVVVHGSPYGDSDKPMNIIIQLRWSRKLVQGIIRGFKTIYYRPV